MDKSNKLYNYIFHFNENTELWAAIPRDKSKDYFNNMNSRVNEGILYAKEHSTLVDFITK